MMKQITLTATCFVVLFFIGISCQNSTIHTNLATDNYSGQVIDSLLAKFKAIKPIEAKPLDKVFQQFRSDFPKAKDIEWEMSENIFRVEFELGETDYKTYYDSEAILLEYGYEIKEKELPAVVKNASVAVFPDYNFENMTKIHRGTEIVYKLELERKDIEKCLFVKNDGILLLDFVY